MAINVTSISASISAFMAIWQLIGMFIPLIKQLIMSAEALFPSGGQGAEKLKFVRDQLEKAFSGLDGVVHSFTDIWPNMVTVIDMFVKIQNTTGWKADQSSSVTVVK